MREIRLKTESSMYELSSNGKLALMKAQQLEKVYVDSLNGRDLNKNKKEVFLRSKKRSSLES